MLRLICSDLPRKTTVHQDGAKFVRSKMDERSRIQYVERRTEPYEVPLCLREHVYCTHDLDHHPRRKLFLLWAFFVRIIWFHEGTDSGR